MRLNKFISESGYCSRREADRLIEEGAVIINGRKAVIGDQVKAGDRIRVNGNDLEPRKDDDLIFIALNKPVGITSTTEEGISDNIVKYVNHNKRIFPIGRLDKDSQGLIFLTNDGDAVNKILRAGNNHEKEYVVTVNKPLTPEAILKMSEGVPMLGVVTKKCKIIQEGPVKFRIILIQGLNRQIRRMCEYVGYDILKLERVRIMNIDLKGLPTGDWRDLTDKELKTINDLVAASSSDDEKKLNPSRTPKKKRTSTSTMHAAPKKGSTEKPIHNHPFKRPKAGNNPDMRKRTTSKSTFRKGSKPKGKR